MPQTSQADTEPTITQGKKSFSLKGKCPEDGRDVPGAGVCVGAGEAAEAGAGGGGGGGGGLGKDPSQSVHVPLS